MSKEMDISAIINGEAFRAINFLIDQKAQELAGWMRSIKSRVSNPHQGYVRVRTYQEVRNREKQEFNLPMHPAELRDIGTAINEVARLDREINDLQLFKLRLLNDYDFTHGDDTIQREVLGSAGASVSLTGKHETGGVA